MPAYNAADVQLLLLTCKLGLGTHHTIDGSSTDEDGWRGALNAAIDHGLIGPFNDSVRLIVGVPERILPEIQAAFLVQASRNLELTKALCEILSEFRKCGIEVAVIKGAAVALLAHGHIIQREFTDLDLLVPLQHVVRARIILDSLGYQQLPKHKCKPRSDKDIQFLRYSDQMFVELHWALNAPARRFPLEANGIWNRLQTVSFQAEGIPTLSTEDTLLALCVHGSVHGWTSLKWAYDVAQIIKHKGCTLDWSALLGRSAGAGCLRTLLGAVLLSSLLFNMKLPNRVGAEIAGNSTLLRITEDMRVSIVEKRPLNRSNLAFFHVQLHDRVWDRLLVAYRYLPDSHQITVRPIRYVVRPFLLLWWHGAKRLCAAIAGH